MKCRDVSIVNHEKKMRWFGSTGAKQSIRPVIPVTVQFEARRNDRYYRVTVKFDISFKLVYNNLASPPQLYAAFHSEYDDASAYITVTSCLVEKKIGIDGTYSSYIHYPATSESSVNGDVLFKNFTADLDDVNASWTPKFNFDCTINDVEYEKNYRNTLHMNCSLDLYNYDEISHLLTAKSADLLMPYITDKLFVFISSSNEYFVRYVSDSFKILDIDNSYNRYAYEVKTSSYLDGTDALITSLRQRLSIIKKELWYNQNYGLSLFDKLTTKSVLDSEIVSLVKAHPDVYDITEFSSSLENRHYTCSMTIKSIFGIVELKL